MINAKIEYIININKEIEEFWSNAAGWAPASSTNLLKNSRLDLQVSLSESLRHWVTLNNISAGDLILILAWVNLGALTEGTLKFFLSVYYEDYKYDNNALIKRDGSLVEFHKLKFEYIKNFLKKLGISNGSFKFLEHIQKRRNSIHAYNAENIGNYNDFVYNIECYMEFLLDINCCLPYPD